MDVRPFQPQEIAMNKKPAMLSNSLLSNRPRRGKARPQTEVQAAAANMAFQGDNVPKVAAGPATEPTTTRRRKRRSEKRQQLNLRVSEETLERFTQLADQRNVFFGDLLVLLLDDFGSK